MLRKNSARRNVTRLRGYNVTSTTNVSDGVFAPQRSIDPNYVNLLYQAAIVHALANRPEDALKDLREAFQKGYSTEKARSDPEFGSLQHRPEFANLLAEFSTPKK